MLAVGLALSQFGFTVAAGLLGGLWLDKQFSTTPWLGFLGLFVGLTIGFQLIMKLVRANKK